MAMLDYRSVAILVVRWSAVCQSLHITNALSKWTSKKHSKKLRHFWGSKPSATPPIPKRPFYSWDVNCYFLAVFNEKLGAAKKKRCETLGDKCSSLFHPPSESSTWHLPQKSVPQNHARIQLILAQNLSLGPKKQHSSTTTVFFFSQKKLPPKKKLDFFLPPPENC